MLAVPGTRVRGPGKSAICGLWPSGDGCSFRVPGPRSPVLPLSVSAA